MAASKSKRVKKIRDKLEFLGCPHVENVDESWMAELLFKHGEPRLRLVHWLLARCDRQVEEILDSVTVVSNLTDSRVGKLLFCANLLGLCHEDDVDLITGISSKSKQLQFYEELVDMLLVVENLGGDGSSYHHDSIFGTPPDKHTSRSKLTTFDEAVAHETAKACGFLDVLCREENLTELFKNEIHLFPPDVEKELQTLNDREHVKKISQVPEISDFELLATQTENDLKKQKKLLETLQKEVYSKPSVDHFETVDNVSRTMSLTMSTLSQMVDGFIHCYETEMKQWSGREKPLLSDIGPVFERVSILLARILQIMKSLKELQNSHRKITNVKCIDMEDNAVPAGKVAVSKLQQCIDILEDAVKRTDVPSDTDSV